MNNFRYWLGQVQDFAAAPDLWDQFLASDGATALPSPEDDNAPFTDDEKAHIRAQLAEVRHYAEATFGLPVQQMQQLEGHLRYLEEAVDRQGKLDWRAIAVGTIVSMAMNALVPPKEVQQVITILLQPVMHIFGHPPLLPPGT